MKQLCLLIILLLSLLPVWAVETRIVGTIHDAGTGQPLSNVQIYFRGTKIGTTSNDEGFFHLHVDMQSKAKLVFTAIGYQSQTYEIVPGAMAGLEVVMEERVYALTEAIAMPGSNPALVLMANVRARRQTNDIAVGEWTSTNHHFISDIQARHLRKRLWHNMEEGMVQMADSTYLLPLPEQGYEQYMIALPEHLNFYQSNIPILSSTFLSPLAASANTFYHFYLLDSTVIRYGEQTEKHYRVHFLPKNTFNPTLSGVLEIDSATCALRRINATMPREANINYLTAMQYDAEYGPASDLIREQISALMEISVKADTNHIFPSLLVTRVGKAKNSSISSTNSLPDTLLASDPTISAFLDYRKPKPLTPNIPDSIVTSAQQSIMDMPLYKVARWVAQTAYTGYMPTGTVVDIGNIANIVGYSRWEGLHMGLPFRTNQKLWQHVALGGYIGYGLRDRAIKYRAELLVDLPTSRRHVAGLVCSDDYIQTEVSTMDALKFENSLSGQNLHFTSFVLNSVYYHPETAVSSAARRREVRFYTENDWRSSDGAQPAVETQFSVQLGQQGYGDPTNYHYYDMPSFGYSSLQAMIRLSWHEQVSDFYMRRYHLFSSFPTVYLGAEIGSYTMRQGTNTGGDYHMYGNIKCMVRQDVALGMAGQLSYLAEAGLILGQVPYPLLAIMNGNQGVTYAAERFTLMNQYQYMADRYLLLHLNWDGRGILFNQIPGVRYIRLHELVEAKIAYGGLSSKHASVLPLPANTATQSLQVPYLEVGVGLGNILRIADVYSVWRLTHRDDNSAALWAIRFRLHLGL